MKARHALIAIACAVSLPAPAVAEEPVSAEVLLEQIRRRLAQPDGVKRATAYVDKHLGADWCGNANAVAEHPELYADLISIGRRAGREAMVIDCARSLLEQQRSERIREKHRVVSATLFETSLIIERLSEHQLINIYQHWRSPEGDNLASYASAGCSAEGHILGSSNRTGKLLITYAQKHAPEDDATQRQFRSHHRTANLEPRVITTLKRAKSGDAAARRVVTRIKRDVARALRQEAFAIYPSAQLAEALERRGEPVVLAPHWHLETTKWAKATKEQKIMLAQGEDPKRLSTPAGLELEVEWTDDLRLALWRRPAPEDDGPIYVRSLAWTDLSPVTRVDEIVHDACDERAHLFATGSEGTVYYDLGTEHVLVTGQCVGYGEDHNFDITAHAKSKTFRVSAESSTYINTMCGPMGSSRGTTRFCQVGEDVTCVSPSRLLTFRLTNDGFKAAIPADLPPRLRKLLHDLDGLSPAQVAARTPALRSQLEEIFPNTRP